MKNALNLSKNKNVISSIVNITKISIIIFMGIVLIGFFNPFYEYPNNSKIYGYQSLLMANGNYEYEHELLKETGDWGFVPSALFKTQHNTAIPNVLPLFPAIGAFSYKLFGLPGLFYLNPIFTIFFLIITERISTKIFGKFVGLLVLIFLATNEMTFWVGSSLLTSMSFSVFFMIGIHFLIKFLRIRSNSYILFASVFFTLSTFIRPNGIIFVPITIGIILTYFFIIKYVKGSEDIHIKKISRKNIFKWISSAIGPWLVFVIFMASFNLYFFGDPTTTMYNIPGSPQTSVSDNSNAFQVNMERLEKYSGHFLPYPLNRVANALFYGETSASLQFEEGVNSLKQIPFLSHIGLSIFFVIGLSLFFSFKKKILRTECSVFGIFIISLMIFYSLNYFVVGRQGAARDMYPVFPLFYGFLGFLIISFLSKPTNIIRKQFSVPTKTIKILLLITLVIFIPTSFYFADYSQIIKKEGFTFNDPIRAAEQFPVIQNSIKKNDIVMTHFEFDEVSRYGAAIFSAYKHFDPQHPLHIEMISKLTEILKNNEHEVYVFKNPHYEHEKNFHIYLVDSDNFVLKDHSEKFCKLELKENLIQKTDKVCLEK